MMHLVKFAVGQHLRVQYEESKEITTAVMYPHHYHHHHFFGIVFQ